MYNKFVLSIIVILSLSLNTNTRNNSIINYNEFGTNFIFLLPLIYYKTKVFNILSYINNSYSEIELLDFLKKKGYTDRDLRKGRRKINLINDLGEDGVNTANLIIKPYLNKDNNSRYIKDILHKINKDTILQNLDKLNMELNKECLNDIINSINH